MFAHHEAAVRKLLELYSPDPEILGILLAGSVAKGVERPDSDLDVIIVVSKYRYAELVQQDRLTECIPEHCDYPGGYFDIKYVDMDYLQEAAGQGSEPTRSAFVGCQVLYSLESKLPELIARIVRYPVEDKEERIRIFHSALMLSSGYFWRMSSNGGNPYFRVRAAADIVLFGMRMIYAYNEVFFPCHKAMMSYSYQLPHQPENLQQMALDLLANPNDDDCMKRFVDTVMNFTDWPVPDNYTAVLSTYVENFERWWHIDHAHPNPYEL